MNWIFNCDSDVVSIIRDKIIPEFDRIGQDYYDMDIVDEVACKMYLFIKEAIEPIRNNAFNYYTPLSKDKQALVIKAGTPAFWSKKMGDYLYYHVKGKEGIFSIHLPTNSLMEVSDEIYDLRKQHYEYLNFMSIFYSKLLGEDIQVNPHSYYLIYTFEILNSSIYDCIQHKYDACKLGHALGNISNIIKGGATV